MAISVPYEQNGTITGTEYSLVNDGTTLQSVTDDGAYQLWLDLSALVDGDEFLLQIKEKVEAAGTQRTALSKTFANSQGNDSHWVSPTLILVHGWDMTLTRISANSRTIAWSIRKIA